MELRPDVVVAGKLRLLRPLGQGGMGVVWEARHLALETDVAVKFLRPDRVAVDPGLVGRFEREAKTTARIRHPNVVQVMDYGAIDGAVPYLVMELLRGFTLADLLERGGRLSLGTAKLVAGQIGRALESAHELGIVHRDVKPHNVLVLEGEKGAPLVVKVLDFGVAKMLGDAQVPGASAALTETGTVIGSPPYMSPEQLEGRKDVDLRADLWSLGIILYEALTGRRPFDGTSFVTVGAAVLKGRYTPASELRPNLGRSIDDFFAKALNVDRDGRFQSARELLEAFDEVGAVELDGHAEAPPKSAGADVRFAEALTEVARLPLVTPEITEVHVPAEVRPSSFEEPSRPEARATPMDASPDAPSPPRRSRAWALAALALAASLVVVWMRVQASGPVACPAGMALVRGASFPMGSVADGETPSDETPQHRESVASYCLDITEVTVDAYAACSTCEPAPKTVEFEGLTPNGRSWESQFCNGPDAHGQPINCVDWNQARAFCKAQGKRLPTEPEWELAARGAEGRLYPWGAAAPAGSRLNACGAECSRMLTERRRIAGTDPWPAMYLDDDGAPMTAPVGAHPEGATPAGVLDLAGNVWEWTDSAYCSYDKPDCGDSRRVMRGGGWDTTEARDVRASKRFPGAPGARGKSIGFRCAKSP